MKEVFLLVLVLVILCTILFLLKDEETEKVATVPVIQGRGFTDEDHDWDPPQLVDNIITEDECQYIIDKATPLFTRSVVVNDTGIDPSRTSDTAWIPRDDPVARKIFEKALEFTDKSLEHCENLQVVRYKPGTFYRAHHDSCCDGSNGCINFEKDGGQRVATLLVYLNDEFTDGETHFPNIDLKMKAPPGSGIVFYPMGKDDNRCHPKALHAGLPPSSGVKYLCNAWIRENKFR
jgi:prolyl 4-hydroxylase